MVTESGPRFCPRCGTARVAGMPFCPNCGLNLAELGSSGATVDRSEERPPTSSTPSYAGTAADDGMHGSAYAEEDIEETAPAADAASGVAPIRRPTVVARDEPTGPTLPLPVLVALLIAGVIVILALNGSGAIKLPASGTGLGGAAATASPTAAGPTFAPTSEAPPVGLAILSPTDGAVVGSKQITVIGSAPAGLRVVHDVPLWIDTSTTSDGTGHWAMTVDLNKGENRLKFRIGDDKSTAKEIRVTYSAPGG